MSVSVWDVSLAVSLCGRVFTIACWRRQGQSPEKVGPFTVRPRYTFPWEPSISCGDGSQKSKGLPTESQEATSHYFVHVHSWSEVVLVDLKTKRLRSSYWRSLWTVQNDFFKWVTLSAEDSWKRFLFHFQFPLDFLHKEGSNLYQGRQPVCLNTFWQNKFLQNHR